MDGNIKTAERKAPPIRAHTHVMFEVDSRIDLGQNKNLTGFAMGDHYHIVSVTVDSLDEAEVDALTTQMREAADRIDEYAQAYRLANPPEPQPARAEFEVDGNDLSRCPNCGDENTVEEIEAGACGGCGESLRLEVRLAYSYPTSAEIDALVNEGGIDA